MWDRACKIPPCIYWHGYMFTDIPGIEFLGFVWGLFSLSADSVNILVRVEDPALPSFYPARIRTVWLILQLVQLVGVTEELPCLWLGLSLTTAAWLQCGALGDGNVTDPGFCPVMTFNPSLAALYWGPICLCGRGQTHSYSLNSFFLFLLKYAKKKKK